MKIFLLATGVILVTYVYFKRFYLPKIVKLYSVLMAELNQYAFQGIGKATFINDGRLQLYKTDSCQIIYFKLNENDDLLIEWRFKYYQQEMVFKDIFYKDFLDSFDRMAKDGILRYSDVSYQKNMAMRAGADNLITSFNEKYVIHKKEVDSKGIPEKMCEEMGISAKNLEAARRFLMKQGIK